LTINVFVGRDGGRRRGKLVRVLAVFEKAHICGLPVAEKSLAVDVFFGNEAPRAGIERVVAVVAEYEIMVFFDDPWGEIRERTVMCRIKIIFVQRIAVDDDLA